jgi:hypothetical protein
MSPGDPGPPGNGRSIASDMGALGRTNGGSLARQSFTSRASIGGKGMRARAGWALPCTIGMTQSAIRPVPSRPVPGVKPAFWQAALIIKQAGFDSGWAANGPADTPSRTLRHQTHTQACRIVPRSHLDPWPGRERRLFCANRVDIVMADARARRKQLRAQRDQIATCWRSGREMMKLYVRCFGMGRACSLFGIVAGFCGDSSEEEQ